MKHARNKGLVAAACAALLATAACGSSVRSACKQAVECLAGSDTCPDCSKENYVDVCEANALAQLVGFETCDDEKCKEASDLYDDYYNCLGSASCDDYDRSRDSTANFTLCKAEAQKVTDASEACREAKKNSCDFDPRAPVGREPVVVCIARDVSECE